MYLFQQLLATVFLKRTKVILYFVYMVSLYTLKNTNSLFTNILIPSPGKACTILIVMLRPLKSFASKADQNLNSFFLRHKPIKMTWEHFFSK